MNKLTKRILSVFLAVAMIVTILPPVTAQAATKTKKITLYVGEKVELPVYCNSITSVSSSKKAVAKAGKNSRRCIITAKKAGNTNITIQYKDYNNKKQKAICKVTVKKPTFSSNVQTLNNGYVLVSVKNTSSAMFDRATLT